MMMYVTMRSVHENDQELTIKDERLRNNLNVTQLTAMPSSGIIINCRSLSEVVIPSSQANNMPRRMSQIRTTALNRVCC